MDSFLSRSVRKTIEWCEACLIADGPEAPCGGRAGPVVWVAYAVFLAVTVLPLVVTRYPPLHDYYHWMYEGHIVAHLLPWGPHADEVTSALWRLDWGPTPNLGAPLAIGVLGTWLSPSAATRLFALASILTFGFGFAYLARSLHRKPTAVEFVGFVWAYGFLTYEGYLSNQFALGLAFFAIGRVHRSVEDAEGKFRWGSCVELAAFGVVIYLCHLFGWLTLGAAVCVYAFRLVLRGRSRQGLRLVATLVPSVLLLGWYTARQTGELGLRWYGAPTDKIVSLVDPLLLFLRTDPFPPLIPVVWSNLLGLVCLGFLFRGALLPRARRGARTLQLAVLLLAVVAILDPIRVLAHAYHPDGRLMLSALLLLLAGLQCKRLTTRGTVAVVVALSPLLVYHAVEFARIGRHMAETLAALERSVPPNAPTLSLTLWGPRDESCQNDWRVSSGTPVLVWFDMVRLLETGGVKTELMRTSLVQHDPSYDPGLVEYVPKMQSLEELIRFPGYRRWVEQFPVVEIAGCPSEIRELRKHLHREYDTVAETKWLLVLRDPRDDLHPRRLKPASEL